MTKPLKHFPVGETEWIPEPDFIDDMYWSGSAPLCIGGCKARHQELRRDPCGDSSCCWLGYKSLCRGKTTWHQPEPLRHRKPSHLSLSHFLYAAVNCGRPDVDYNGMVYGNDWWVGSVVRYACRSGFMLVGSPTRSCQPNGLWTPKPLCLREFTEFTMTQRIKDPWWTWHIITWPQSASLLGMCQRGRIEISERELNGTCNSTCTNKSYSGPPKHGCTQIDNCKKKESGWKRFFAQCVPCICDCALSCRESFPHKTAKHKWRTSWTDAIRVWCPCKERVCLLIFSICSLRLSQLTVRHQMRRECTDCSFTWVWLCCFVQLYEQITGPKSGCLKTIF